MSSALLRYLLTRYRCLACLRVLRVLRSLCAPHHPRPLAQWSQAGGPHMAPEDLSATSNNLLDLAEKFTNKRRQV